VPAGALVAQNVPLKHCFLPERLFCFILKHYTGQVLVAYTCNPTTWEAEIRRPAQVNSLRGPVSKITRAKWTEYVAQAVEHLLCKFKALSSNTSPTKKQKAGLTHVILATWEDKIRRIMV
jgi:hypothetical protein